MKELAGLLRDGNMKEFYKIANKVLMIRASNPVVRSIKTGIEGEQEVTEDRVLVEEAKPVTLKTSTKNLITWV